MMTIRYIEKGAGLHDAIQAAGLCAYWQDGQFVTPNPADEPAIQAIIDAYDPLPLLRATLSAAVVNERISRQQIGAPFTFPDGVAGTIQTRNEQDLLNINGLATRAMMAQLVGDTGITFAFRDQENRTHSLTGQQVAGLAQAAASFVEALYMAKWAHDGAIAAWDGSTPYDVTAGWPG